jgi:hypothetical protein
MRIFYILILVLFAFEVLPAQEVPVEDVRLDYICHQKPLAEVFNDLSAKTGVSIIFFRAKDP